MMKFFVLCYIIQSDKDDRLHYYYIDINLELFIKNGFEFLTEILAYIFAANEPRNGIRYTCVDAAAAVQE